MKSIGLLAFAAAADTNPRHPGSWFGPTNLERFRNPKFNEGSANWKTNCEFAEDTSASLTTKSLAQWPYGRFEMRAKIDTRAGIWPAFWTVGAEGRWPANGEIDVMEYYRGTRLAT